MSRFKKEDIDKILDDAEEKERDAEIENLFDDIFDKGTQGEIKQGETKQGETKQGEVKMDESNNEEIIEIPCDDSSDDSSDDMFSEQYDNQEINQEANQESNQQSNEQDIDQESNQPSNEQSNEQSDEQSDEEIEQQSDEQQINQQTNEQSDEQDIEQQSDEKKFGGQSDEQQTNQESNQQTNEQETIQCSNPQYDEQYDAEIYLRDDNHVTTQFPGEGDFIIETLDGQIFELKGEDRDEVKDEAQDKKQGEDRDEVKDEAQGEKQGEAQERVIEVETTDKKFDVNKANELRDKVFKDIKTDYLNLSYDPLNVNMELIDENKNQYYNYILSGLLIPTTQLGRTLHINNFIRDITSYSSFDCFASPNLSFEYSPAERIYIMTRLNTLFDFQFMNVTNLDNITFENISSNISKFLSNYSNQQSIRIEHQIIKAFINKLIIALNTEEELAFRDNSIRIDKQFQLAIANDLREIKSILSTDQNNKITKSWNVFIEAFLSLGNEVQIFKFKDYADLNNKLRAANKTDFLYENLLGNMLKTYLPSIAYNYFSVIKIMYMLARFIGVYISNKIYSNRGSEEIARDLKVIAASCVITYENKNYIFKQMARTLPRYSKPLSEQGQMYITNHMIVGGQYYLLKYVEESISIIEVLLR